MKKRHVRDESGMGWLKDCKDKEDRERYGENRIVRTDVSTGGLKIEFVVEGSTSLVVTKIRAMRL